MNNKFIVLGPPFSGKTKLISHVYDSLGNILNIHGYRTEPVSHGKDSADLRFFSFRSKKFITEKDCMVPTQPLSVYDTLLTSRLISEITLFPTPDMFLIDEINTGECETFRLRNQLKTILLSKVPVIATVSEQNWPLVKSTFDQFPFTVLNINSDDHERLYFDLIGRLT